MFKNIIEQFVFFPVKGLEKTPELLNLHYNNIYIYLQDNKIHGWYIKNENNNNPKLKDKVILFFHGNAGNISYRLNYIHKFYDMGFNLLFYDYPGFGFSQGNPNEENCVQSGKLFYDYLMNEKKFKHENIIFYGESIGGAISANLGNQLNIKYLILQSTFSDIKEIIQKLAIHNYLGILINNLGFETIEYLKNRNKKNMLKKIMKTMIIHSNQDELIDVKYIKPLEDYCNEFNIVEGTHSNINIDEDLIYKIINFISN